MIHKIQIDLLEIKIEKMIERFVVITVIEKVI